VTSRALVGLALAFALALACGGSDPAPAPDVAPVDENDVHCDPLADVVDDATSPATPTVAPFVKWVDPFIGTGGVAFGTGSTYPGPQVPFGMARPGPDTSHLGGAIEFAHCAGYSHDDDVIEGFSHLRLHGAGIADYGGLALMPTIGATPTKAHPRSKGSHFRHETEKASPGYYAVTLDDGGIDVELTASAHVAFHRWKFPLASDAVVYVDAGHVLSEGTAVDDATITVDPAKREVRGFSHVMGSYSDRFGGIGIFWTVRFRRAFGAFATYVAGTEDATTTKQGKDAGAWLRFDTSADSIVEAEVAASYVDGAHATANVDAETSTFDAARAAATAAWEKRLARVVIDARSDRDRRIFYTALYHTALMPALASDADGAYRGLDGKVHSLPPGKRYFNDYSLWDTYRTLHPFLALAYPEDAGELAASLVQMGTDAGYLPRWPLAVGETGGMVGDGATIALADAYLRAVPNWDARAGYAIARKQATTVLPAEGRSDMADVLALGYVPNDKSGAAAKTLENAAADFALGEWADSLGEKADADRFHDRAAVWKKLYDPSTHFLFPLARDGTRVPQNPTDQGGAYVEGTAWHYNFMVPFDVAGLEGAMTRPVLLGRLDQLFARFACSGKPAFLPNPYYWPSNEPVLFSGFAFGVLGDRTRLGRWIRWTTVTHFGDGPDGIPGNDDGGTMSAFYLGAASGLYPIAGTSRWVLGTPLFPKVVFALPTGALTIEAPAASRRAYVAQTITRNGTALTAGTIEHADLANATLRFEMR
jgi:predicted alpha-1,2-mannosidase